MTSHCDDYVLDAAAKRPPADCKRRFNSSNIPVNVPIIKLFKIRVDSMSRISRSGEISMSQLDIPNVAPVSGVSLR